MSKLVAKLAGTVVLAFVVGACSDPLGPGDFAGRYQLRSIAGDPLPAVIFQSGTGSHYVISERLEISEADGAVFTRDLEARPQTGPVRPYTLTSTYRLEVEGDHLLLFFICPPNALCTAELPPPVRAYREPDGGLRIEGLISRGPLRYGPAIVGLPQLL
jgi:hypothetical protein